MVSRAVGRDGFHRQLFIDKPNTGSQQTYRFRGARNSTDDTNSMFVAGSSLAVFEYPDTIKGDVLTSDISLPDGDGLTWHPLPSRRRAPARRYACSLPGSSRVGLPMSGCDVETLPLSLHQERLTTALPGTTALQEDDFPGNFEDWVDYPNATSEQTYTLQMDNFQARYRSPRDIHSCRAGGIDMAMPGGSLTRIG